MQAHQAAVEIIPCFVVAAYAFLLLAAAQTGAARLGLPPPEWRRMASGGETPRPA